jgi:fibronectin type 3 domain-containing protein
MRLLRRAANAVLAMFMVAAGLIATTGTASAADTSPPTQPGAITVSSLTATSATLSWAKSTDDVGVVGYRVYRGPASAADTQLAWISSLDVTSSYSATRLYSGTAYKFGIQAIDAANNKSVMRTVTFTTLNSSDTTPPAAPSSSPTASVFSADRIDLTWPASDSGDVASYQVLRNSTVVATVDLPASLRYSDNGLSASTAYSYTIKAIDSNGLLSTASPARSATTLAPGTVTIARGPFSSRVTGSSAVISWWTNEPTTGSVTVGGTTVIDPVGSTRHHEIAVTGLPSGTSHSYTVTSGAATATGTFRTARPSGQTFSFAMIGDFGGGGGGATENAASIKAAGTDFIQTVGDNVYPSSGPPDPNFATTYSDFDQRFFKPFGPTVKDQAFFPANGNKEYYGDGQWWDAFPMHGSNHSWYSYDWGDAHILVLDTEVPYSPGTEQYAFAEVDLAANQNAKWRIVVTHGPPYSSTSAGSSSDGVRTHLVPLFQARNVHLVASGNSHNYERTYPLIDGDPVTTGGVTYLVTGAGGNGRNTFQMAQPAYSAFRQDAFYQYTKVTVSPTELLVEGRRSDTGVVFDSTTITHGGGSGGGTTTLSALADARVEQANPTTNYGTSSTLGADQDSIAQVESYLKFNPSLVTGTVTNAKLRLWTTTGSTSATTNGPAVYGVSTDWAEGTITWNNKPGRAATATANSGALAVDSLVEYDVTDLVKNATYNFSLVPDSTDGTSFNSRSNSATTKRPQLVVMTSSGSGDDTTPPTAPTGLSATAVSSSQVDLDWNASADDVGVTGYDVYRGTTLINTVTGTSTSDTTVAAGTTYSYTVKAKDAAGNVSPASDPATVTTPGGGSVTTTLNALADARVEQANPTTNYGTSSTLAADQSSTAQVESYLKFDETVVTGTVTSAKLRLWTTTGSTSATTNGPAVYGVSTDWAEGMITWDNKPGRAATATDNAGALAIDSMVEYDVTNLVANGTYNFSLVPDSTDGTSFNSRSNAATTKRPQLVVTTTTG